MLVTWSDPEDSPDLEDGVAGFAGPQGGDPDGEGPRLLTGAVVLDAPQMARMHTRPKSLGVVLHELGHLPGTLRGLAAVGNGRCFPPD